ncbi:MAG: hypothetical protein ABIJ30_06380 [bacterium]
MSWLLLKIKKVGGFVIMVIALAYVGFIFYTMISLILSSFSRDSYIPPEDRGFGPFRGLIPTPEDSSRQAVAE